MEPITITVTLSLDEWAAGQHYQGSDGEWQSDLPGPLEGYVVYQVVSQLAQRLQPEITKRITSMVLEGARTYADQMVREVLSGPIRETDGYGNPRGEATTLHELVLKQTEKALGSHRDYMGRKSTLLHDVINEEVTKAFTAELKPIITEAKAKATQAVRDRAADMLAKEMERK